MEIWEADLEGVEVIVVDEETAKAAVFGGSILGGGGGGRIEEGLTMAKKALELGKVKIVDVKEIDSNSVIVTVSAVGVLNPRHPLTVEHLVRSVELLISKEGIKATGLISSENGAFSTVNGWPQAAALHMVVVDSPADGRAHPLGIMGSMGLHNKKEYVSVQTAVGGNRDNRIEVIVKGNLEIASRIVRQASIEAGGVVAVARNPVSLSYVKENGAPGALTQAINVGRVFLRNRDDVREAAYKVAELLKGVFIDEGVVSSIEIAEKGGFNVGLALVKSSKGKYSLTFLNEYMTLELDNSRIATFPDLITLIDMEKGIPILSSDLKTGQKVCIIKVAGENLILGQGVKDRKILKMLENIIGRKVI